MSSVGLETKSLCAVEGQQQFGSQSVTATHDSISQNVEVSFVCVREREG
jgi:hypothetical protein